MFSAFLKHHRIWRGVHKGQIRGIKTIIWVWVCVREREKRKRCKTSFLPTNLIPHPCKCNTQETSHQKDKGKEEERISQDFSSQPWSWDKFHYKKENTNSILVRLFLLFVYLVARIVFFSEATYSKESIIYLCCYFFLHSS